MAEWETAAHAFPFLLVAGPQSRNPFPNDYLVMKYNITDSSAIVNEMVDEIIQPDQEYSHLLDMVIRDMMFKIDFL